MPTAPRTAMVLAAGLGERMRPLTDRMPKPLVAVAGKPLIDHVLDRLAAAGVERAVVNVHYLADQIERHAPFIHVNSDTIWIDGEKPNLEPLAEAFDPATMDALLLLAPVSTSIGYPGRGDFIMATNGRLTKRGERDIAPFVYAGVAILRPELFKDAPDGAFSLTTLFQRAEAEGRLHGLRLEGLWMHVGTPEAIKDAEAAIAASAA